MSELRHLFSARSARPKIEASIRAVVQAAIYLASADGEVKEPEVEVLVDDLRAVMLERVGEEQLDTYVNVGKLLDIAREARRELMMNGEQALLIHLHTVLEGNFRKEALRVALDVVRADGKVTDAERSCLDKLGAALGVEVGEVLSQRPA